MLRPPLRPLLCLLMASAAGWTAEIAPPRGLFASAGSTESAVVDHPQCRGFLIRVPWKKLETSPGTYTWSAIDNQLSLLRAAGKSWSLAVVAGPSSPDWLYANPYLVAPLNIRFRDAPVMVPKFWDPILQERLRLLAQALAGRYHQDAGLRLIYLPQMSANGIEGHFNGAAGSAGTYRNDSPPSLTSQGLSETLWVEAVLSATRSFATAFPAKPIAVELHNLLDSASAGKRIMQGITADPGLADQVGVAIWWLSGKTDYQTELLTAMDGFPGEVYAQLIGKASDSGRFLENDYWSALIQAQAMGIRYVEPWEVDFKSGLWNDKFRAFNVQADSNSP